MKNVKPSLLPILKVPGKKDFVVKWNISEGFEHLSYKIIIVAQLLNSGFKKKNILFEYSQKFGKRNYRADIFVRKEKCTSLKEIWFELGTTNNRKLKIIRKKFEGRIIYVIEANELRKHWKCSFWKKQERHQEKIKNYRKDFFPMGIEFWGILPGGNSARILMAMRRDGEDRFTFFNTGEWSLSQWGYIKKKDKIDKLKIG
jgi:hypothetical protein